jgi:hypothetical protein
MKKQHFLLILILALFAGISSGYSQCVPGPLTPAAGIPYDYSAVISGTGYNGTNANGAMYDWYITDNTDLLNAGAILTPPTMFTVDPSTPYHNGATGVNHILVTWTPAAITDGGPFYLVLRYRENNSTTAPTTCSAENIRVWNIVPVNTFLLALDGAMLSGGNYVINSNAFTCAADVVGATVNPGVPDATLVYGNNTLYYIATASGILGNWRPDIRVPALQTSQVYVSAQWTADMTGAGGWVAFPIAATGATQDLQSPTDATVTNAVAGTPILIRIVINNMNWQTLADQPITLGLDGYLPIAYTVSDIIGGGNCNPEPVFGRTAISTIKARPTITGTPATLPLTNP